jgi:hypothetical protein
MMFDWFKKSRRPERQPWRPLNEIRLARWQANDKLVGEARIRLGDSFGAMLRDVLRAESPSTWVKTPNATTEERAAHQAQIEGYHFCLNTLEALMVHRPAPEPIEETWEPEFRSNQTTYNANI